MNEQLRTEITAILMRFDNQEIGPLESMALIRATLHDYSEREHVIRGMYLYRGKVMISPTTQAAAPQEPENNHTLVAQTVTYYHTLKSGGLPLDLINDLIRDWHHEYLRMNNPAFPTGRPES